MRKMCKDCLHFDHCINIPNYPVTNNTIACDDWLSKDKYAPVVHGRWETANDGTHFCSRCGCDAPYTWDDVDRNFVNSADDVPDRPSNYCHECGAKMDLED